MLYTAAGATTFYVGSAFVSFQVPQYREFFVEQVPLGASLLQYAEDHEWDNLTASDVLDGVGNLVVVSKEFFDSVMAKFDSDKAKDTYEKTKEKASHAIEQSRDKVKAVAKSVTTSVEKAEKEVSKSGAKAAAIARHQSVQFSEGVEDLVRKAEAALANKPAPSSEATTTPEQPATGAPDAVPPAYDQAAAEQPSNVYSAPLPVGFEPPPGYTRPKPPPTPKAAAKAEAAAPAPPPPEPLPLVAPAVSEFSASEPVIAQLATVIDDLASYLNANPTAADKARDILDTAKVDLTALATRINDIKAAEAKKLEASLDEQARECMQSLMEMEMQAQDKLDSQEESFRKFFEQERAKMIHEYRQKLAHELQTQSEIINERYVAFVSIYAQRPS